MRAQRARCPRTRVLREITVALLRDVTFETRLRDIRSSGRLNSRVAVAVEWTDGEQSLRAEGYTVDIGAKGCLAIVPQGFGVGQKLRLVNLTNQISCEAVLAWRGHEGRTGWELGLELQEPAPDFWGLDF
jgi:PilZ domain